MRTPEIVQILPRTIRACDSARVVKSWGGLMGEHTLISRCPPHDFNLQAQAHYLALLDARRSDGETFVDGLPRSVTRDGRGKLIFVPAGCRLMGWAQPTGPVIFTAAYINVSQCAGLTPREAEALYPMLHFESPILAEMMIHLRKLVQNSVGMPLMYMEAFGTMLMAEISRLQRSGASAEDVSCSRITSLGGLAGWQVRAVCDYIEDHLPRDLSVSELAGVAGLSEFHFCRAFKKSLGEPPHRYHTGRRIERAAILLQTRGLSISDVAAAVGYGSASQFSAAFKTRYGRSPGQFRRL